jgi:ABC-2 type transport system ATP-binding protein
VVDVKHPSANIYELEAATDLRAEAARAVVTVGGRLRSLDLQQSSLDDIYTHYFSPKGTYGQEVDHVPAAPTASN